MGLRIAFTHAFCWPEVRRGGERILHELSAALARRGHAVSIFAGASSSSMGTEDGVRIRRMTRRAPDTNGAETHFGLRVTVPLIAGRFDIVHSLGARDAVASLRARAAHRQRRTVYTNLGNPVKEWWDGRPDRRAHAHVVRKIDAYGCLSVYGLNRLRSDYGREGYLTPGGVRLDTFRPDAPKEPTPTLLYSGALYEPRKGVATLLEATAILVRREPRLRLWLSGTGDPSSLIASAPRAAQERVTVLRGDAPQDQAARFAAAWATVLPSIGEAFGLVLVESLACGTPIVGADHSAIPELIEPDTGVLAPPDDPVALADACERALTLARERGTVERCREAARRHDWDEAVAPVVEEVYLSIR